MDGLLGLLLIDITSNSYLIGGFNPSEKYWSVGMIIPNIWKNKKCSKPPTSYYCGSFPKFPYVKRTSKFLEATKCLHGLH